MISQHLQAHLDDACAKTVAKDVKPEDWELGRIFFKEEGAVTIAWGADYLMIRVSLFGDAQHDFEDWLKACESRSVPGWPPRSNLKVPQLGHRIVFYPATRSQ